MPLLAGFLTEVINSCFYDSQIYIIHVIILSVCYFLFVYPALVLLSVFFFLMCLLVFPSVWLFPSSFLLSLLPDLVYRLLTVLPSMCVCF